MSDIQKALVHKVTTDAGVIALIGTRFYDRKLPQSVTLPAATYQFVTGGELQHHHNEPSLLPNARLQITVFGHWGTHDVGAIDRAIKSAIDGSRATWGTGAYQTEVQRCVAETGFFDDLDPESGLYLQMRDYRIMYLE